MAMCMRFHIYIPCTVCNSFLVSIIIWNGRQVMPRRVHEYAVGRFCLCFSHSGYKTVGQFDYHSFSRPASLVDLECGRHNKEATRSLISPQPWPPSKLGQTKTDRRTPTCGESSRGHHRETIFAIYRLRTRQVSMACLPRTHHM